MGDISNKGRNAGGNNGGGKQSGQQLKKCQPSKFEIKVDPPAAKLAPRETMKPKQAAPRARVPVSSYECSSLIAALMYALILQEVELASSLSLGYKPTLPQEDGDLDFSAIGQAVRNQPPIALSSAYKNKYGDCDVFNVANMENMASLELETECDFESGFPDPDTDLKDAAAAMALEDPSLDLDSMLDLDF